MSICMGTSWKWGVCWRGWDKPIPYVSDASSSTAWHLSTTYTAKARDRVSREVISERHRKGPMLELLPFSKRKACRSRGMQESLLAAAGSCPKKREGRTKGFQKRLQSVLLWLWPSAYNKLSRNEFQLRKNTQVIWHACLNKKYAGVGQGCHKPLKTTSQRLKRTRYREPGVGTSTT